MSVPGEGLVLDHEGDVVAVAGALEAEEEVVDAVVGFGEVGGGLGRGCGDAGVLELSGGLPDVLVAGPLGDGCFEFVFGVASALEGLEVWAVGEVWALDELAECAPVGEVADGEGEPDVAAVCGEESVGGEFL